MPKIKADLRAYAQLSPKGSQVVIVSLAVLLGICLVGGIAFLYVNALYSTVPFAFSIGFIVLIVRLWSESHKSADAHLSPPTSFTHYDGNRLTTLTTDASTLKSPEGIAAFGRLLSMVQKRRPLPEPAGLIDQGGKPIDESASKAMERVRGVNELVHEMRSSVFDSSKSGSAGEQSFKQTHQCPEPPGSADLDKSDDDTS